MKKQSVKKKKIHSKKTLPQKLKRIVKAPFIRLRTNIRNFQARRPHRSFRLTRRRDYRRSLNVPGYWSFSIYVANVLRKSWRLFILLVFLYGLFGLLFGMMTSLGTYRNVGALLEEGFAGIFNGGWAAMAQAGILSLTVFLGGATQSTDVQKIYVGLTLLLTWLTTVWLLRELLADRKPKLRDGLYNAGAPILSTIMLVLYLLIQLVPVGLLVIAYSALAVTGIISQGFPLFLVMTIATLITALTLYWVTPTLIAMVVVTLPGMYPAHALKASGDLVVGRRLRILFRWLWMVLMVAVVWLVVMVPLVLLDTWLSSTYQWPWLDWLPVVPFIALLLSSASTIWIASYIYLLYRKVVDDDAAPA